MRLRKANMEDSKFIYDLRNSKDVRAVSATKNKILWNVHANFMTDNITSYQIIELSKQPIGYVRDIYGDISIVLMKEYRNMGFGTSILRQTKGNATVLTHNIRSLHSFMNAGYKVTAYVLKK